MCHLLIVCLLSALLLIHESEGRPCISANAAKPDPTGTWVLSKGELGIGNEKPFALPSKDSVKVIVKDNKVTLIDGALQKKLVFKLYSESKPMQLDVIDVIEDENGVKRPLKCIIVIEKDSLKIAFCLGFSRFGVPYVHPDAARPRDFNSSDEALLVKLHFVREPMLQEKKGRPLRGGRVQLRQDWSSRLAGSECTHEDPVDCQHLRRLPVTSAVFKARPSTPSNC